MNIYIWQPLVGARGIAIAPPWGERALRGVPKRSKSDEKRMIWLCSGFALALRRDEIEEEREEEQKKDEDRTSALFLQRHQLDAEDQILK